MRVNDGGTQRNGRVKRWGHISFFADKTLSIAFVLALLFSSKPPGSLIFTGKCEILEIIERIAGHRSLNEEWGEH